ncbi:MAG: S24 family peptidase, partial [Megasphaera massiliensis]|uniref:LexA family protein n=1 Tax=Megasphaera massiliensis TaxID=1232428 RepID=UPI002A763B62
PIEAVEEILDYEEITPELAATGEFFALQVKGDSMEPTLRDGDVVIVKKQPTVDSGDIAIVLVNGNDATVKEIKESPAGITLIGHNAAIYTPQFYSNEDIKNLPVQVLGKVIEMRRKF